jgi:competence protein ComEA
MNAAEKRFLFLALFLFGFGWIARLPALDRFTELAPVELASVPAPSESSETSETKTEIPPERTAEPSPAAEISEDSPPKSKSGGKKAPSGPIPINRATAKELCAIKGIGPALAARIIEHREQKGPFRSAKDLTKVSGIGEKKRKDSAEWVVFD